MTLYPKWEAYLQLKARIPEWHVPRHELCKTLKQMFSAWKFLRDDDGTVGIRTDCVGGGMNLPFIARASSLMLHNVYNTLAPRGLVFLVAENIWAEINGKAIRLDDEHVLIEWGRCETARELDAGRAVCERSMVLGPNSIVAWGDTLLRSFSPERGYGVQADRLYKLLLSSGLKESCWSLTDKERRLVLWG